jgi:hypothetical protein
MSFATELSETDDDLKWQRIINDPRPRPALSALGDEIETHFKNLPPGRDRQNLRPEPLPPAPSLRQRTCHGDLERARDNINRLPKRITRRGEFSFNCPEEQADFEDSVEAQRRYVDHLIQDLDDGIQKIKKARADLK